MEDEGASQGDGKQGDRFSQLVVVGSSAGGIEALPKLLSTLRPEFPAPIVIGQHVSRHRPSHLGEILARHSPLPIRTVEDDEPLEPGVVYLVPANRHVEISDHQIGVREDPEADRGEPMPSVDRLFRSAAQVFGEGLIAVILTGNGSDGAAGARAVKVAGGTVIIQNPETASFPSMPLSLAPTTVDVVANLQAIGPLLHDLLTGAYGQPRPEEERTLQLFLEQVRERSGIDFNSYRHGTIVRRLQRRIAATGTNNLREYIRYTQAHPEEYQRLVSSFLIKVTEFFRDPELFAHLREVIVPELIREARQRGNELRVWSAGCATGEESYSLAILISEALGEELDRFNVRIFATDLDHEAVAFARRGVYHATAIAGVSAELVARYFTHLDDSYEVRKSVRGLVVFGEHDLGQRAPFPRVDLALCRNVLIYFTAELQQRALQLFAFALRDGGYLVLGKAETTNPLPKLFALEEPSLKVFRRIGDRVLMPPGRIRDTMSSPVPRPGPTRRAAGSLDQALTQAQAHRIRPSGKPDENLLLRLPIGLVVIDDRYDVQVINAVARRLLGIHGSAVGEDFLHLVRNLPLSPLRDAIDAAFRNQATSHVYEAGFSDEASPEPTYLEVQCSPHRTESGNDRVSAVLIQVTDVTAATRELRELRRAQAEQREELERLTGQVQRLSEANRSLLEANQELATVNAELQGANEELLVANEEVQAATEEVETLNEELQATNEELETLNEELQATVEELNTTNDDLEARSLELQDLALSLEQQRATSEAERARLQAILVSMGDAVLVVDAEGAPILTNSAYDELFAAEPELQDEDGRALPPERRPERLAARGESFGMQFTTTGPDGARRWFEAIGHPIRGGGQQGGGVVLIRDITERSLRRLQDEFMALASHELRTPLTALTGYLQMVAKQLARADANGPARRYVDVALRQAGRMGALVRDLFDVTRLQSGRLSLQLEPIDLVPVVHQAVEVAQLLTQGQALDVQTPTAPIRVHGDAGRLEQVVLNLLTNAITYAPGAERIDVRLRSVGGRTELEVRDYGPGIPEADLPNVFSRLYQVSRSDRTAGGGLGLGLYISKELVAAHGGSIEVASTAGQGTTFTVRLPLLEE